MHTLDKKRIVIVGGAGRLGQIFVNELLRTNTVIVIDMCNKEAWRKLNIDSHGFIETDINDPITLTNSISEIKRKYGQIDCVINTSYPRNKDYGKSVLDVSLESFNQNINLHLGGYFHVMQRFTQLFIEQGYGNIINISSIQGISAPKFSHYEGTNMDSPIEYTAAKTAIIAMTRYLVKFLKDKNIRINCISPGGILDNQPESFLEKYKDSCINKGMLDSQDILGAIKFLISEDSRFINGQNIIVDDGWSL